MANQKAKRQIKLLATSLLLLLELDSLQGNKIPFAKIPLKPCSVFDAFNKKYKCIERKITRTQVNSIKRKVNNLCLLGVKIQ